MEDVLYALSLGGGGGGSDGESVEPDADLGLNILSEASRDENLLGPATPSET